MKVEVNPYRDLESNITPTEFEKFCMEVLKSYARREGLRDFKISHNKKLKAHDGVYQIDVLAEFTALGVKNTVLVECKKQSRSVERDEAASLYEKLQSLGAQKGIIISTSGFQSGTTAYAKAHGIALWQICDNIINHINNCGSAESLLWQENLLKIERYLLKYNSFYCSETKVIKSKVYSVFDLLYDDYAPVLEEMNRRLKKISEYKSENIIATVIDDVLKEISAICEDNRYGALAFRHNFPLKYILKIDSIEDPDDKRFVRNPNTHCDFVIYNTLDKSVELVVEVDGKYPHSQPEQIARDRRKDRLLSDAGIKLLRLSTTAVRCREKILEKLLG